MFRLAVATALALACSLPARGADVLLNTTGAKPGRYVLTVNADGSVSVGPFLQVIDLSVTPTPGPNPPPQPPTPNVLTDRAKAIRDAALKVPATGNPSDPDRATTAAGLTDLYRRIAALVRAGQITDEPALFKGVQGATVAFLGTRGNPPGSGYAAWQPFRDLLGRQWTEMEFNRAELSAYADFLEEVASGLEASAPKAGAISPDMLKLILQILQIVFSLLPK